MDIRERLPHLREDLLQALAARPLSGEWVELEEIGGDQLVAGVQVVAVEDLLREAADDGLVLLAVRVAAGVG